MMIKLFKLISLVLLPHFAWATNPLILNLANNEYLDFYGDKRTFDPCWNEDGHFLVSKCEKKVYECSVDGTFTNGKLLKVKVYPEPSFIRTDSNLIQIGVNGLKDKDRLRAPWSTMSDVPVGAEVVTYIFDGNFFNIFERVKVSENGVIQLSNKKIVTAHQKITLSMGDNWPKDAFMSVSILGQGIRDVKPGREIYFWLAEGDYILDLRAYAGEKTYESFYPISITNKKIDKYTVEIDFNEFSDTMEDQHPRRELVLNGHTISFKLQDSDSTDTSYGFEEISLIRLSNNNTLLTDFFDLKKSTLEIKDPARFSEAIKKFPVYNLKIRGKCGTYYSRVPHESYPIFSKPYSKKMGDIHIFSINNEFRAVYENAEGKQQEFSSNLDVSHYNFYFQAVSKEGEFSNLGKGVWGEEAWIKAPSDHLFSSDNSYYFQGKSEDEYVEFFKSYNGDLFKRLVNANELNRDSIFYGDIVKTKESELFDDKGIIKLPIIDMGISYRNSMEIPQLVDLTNGEISIEGQVKSSKISLFKEPDDSSSILGHLEFTIEGEGKILSGVFWPVAGTSSQRPYVSDYYQGLCSGHFKYSALNNVEKVFNQFSQIGKGPWGDKAWVKSQRFDITDRRLPVTLLYKNEHILRLIDYWDAQRQFNIHYDGQSPFLINREDIIEAGKISLKPYCPSGYKANLSQVVKPRYISLIPDSLEGFSHSKLCGPLNSSIPSQVCKPLKEFSVDLFEKPDKKSQRIGEITSVYDPSIGNNGMVQLFFRRGGVEQKFETNFYGDYCDLRRKHLYLQLVWGDKDDWANLGEGIWGKEAWVYLQPKPVIGEDDFLYFFDDSLYSVRLVHGDDGEILMKHRVTNSEKKLRLEDILYPNGLMKFRLDCDGGC